MSRLTARERLHREVTGDQLTTNIINVARRFGWLAHHSRPARRTSSGRWETPLQGDSGLPDIILVRPPEVWFIEVKREVGDDLTPTQERWRDALLDCDGVRWLIVRPSDFDWLVRRLTGAAELAIEREERRRLAEASES